MTFLHNAPDLFSITKHLNQPFETVMSLLEVSISDKSTLASARYSLLMGREWAGYSDSMLTLVYVSPGNWSAYDFHEIDLASDTKGQPIVDEGVLEGKVFPIDLVRGLLVVDQYLLGQTESGRGIDYIENFSTRPVKVDKVRNSRGSAVSLIGVSGNYEFFLDIVIKYGKGTSLKVNTRSITGGSPWFASVNMEVPVDLGDPKAFSWSAQK